MIRSVTRIPPTTNAVQPAIFFDRDGVLNVDHGYVCSSERLEWIPGAFDAVKLAHQSGYLAVVITNQSGIDRGYFTDAEFREFTFDFLAEFQNVGSPLDGLFYCPSLNDERRRKPAPGMIIEAATVLDIDLSTSLFIGDKLSDMEAAAAAGVPGALFDGGNLREFLEAHLQALVVN